MKTYTVEEIAEIMSLVRQLNPSLKTREAGIVGVHSIDLGTCPYCGEPIAHDQLDMKIGHKRPVCDAYTSVGRGLDFLRAVARIRGKMGAAPWVSTMPLVLVESPYGSPDPLVVQRNVEYLRRALKDCIARGESPYASHGLIAALGVLDDDDASQRAVGIACGEAFRRRIDKIVAYMDYGLSKGMEHGLSMSKALGVPIEERKIGWNPIAQKADVCGGEACLANTRVAVWMLVEARDLGMNDAKLLEQFPIKQADLDAAWDYAKRHKDEIALAIKENELK